MGAIAFSSRAGHPASVSNWLSPVQAVFAFFAPLPNSPHAQANLSPNEVGSILAPRETAIQPAGRCTLRASSPVSQTNVRTETAVVTARTTTSVSADVPSPRKNDRACLKILREFEPGKSRSSTGRLVISGRMVDVCAALDRMAVQGSATPAKH